MTSSRMIVIGVIVLLLVAGFFVAKRSQSDEVASVPSVPTVPSTPATPSDPSTPSDPGPTASDDPNAVDPSATPIGRSEPPVPTPTPRGTNESPENAQEVPNVPQENALDTSGQGGARPLDTQYEVIQFRGKPTGKTIRVAVGKTVWMEVRSTVPGEIYVQGYDIYQGVAPQQPARFQLKAVQRGSFPVLFDQNGARVATLIVK